MFGYNLKFDHRFTVVGFPKELGVLGKFFVGDTCGFKENLGLTSSCFSVFLGTTSFSNLTPQSPPAPPPPVFISEFYFYNYTPI
jgi:hypothetical protein